MAMSMEEEGRQEQWRLGPWIWMSLLATGGLTWLTAELTEPINGLYIAVSGVLTVGIWAHTKYRN